MIGWLWMLGCSASVRAPEPVATGVLAELESVRAQQEGLRSSERTLLRTRAEAALASGDTHGALVALRMGLQVDPEGFGPLADRLQSEASTAEELALLAEAFAADEARAARLRAEADVQAVRERWSEPLRATSLESTAGATEEMGAAILAGVAEEYVIEPDTAAMAAAARARLRRVAEAWGLQAPGDSAEALGAVRAAIEVGLPEPVAVVEGTDAALASLDPYTRAVWPAWLQGWEQHHAGVTVGVGLALLDGPQGTVVVEHPVLDSPAWPSGIHQGDHVIRLVAGEDEVRVAELPAPRAEAVTAALTGSEGTPVSVEIERGGAAQTFALTRASVPVPTVSGWRRRSDNQWDPWVSEGIAFIRIEAFRSSTDEDVRSLVEGLAPQAVIVDLRGNGGGDVSAAVNTADLFVEDGQLALLAGRTATEPELEEGEVAWNTALSGDPLEGLPTAVLVDGETASAAEILAGSLRERAGAVIIGERTFGKGLSQALRTAPDGGFGWQVTNLMWTLPSGTPVEPLSGQDGGLAPDVEVVLTPAERFQVGVLRARREALQVHADGTPMAYLGTVRGADLPHLGGDPQVLAARVALLERLSVRE